MTRGTVVITGPPAGEVGTHRETPVPYDFMRCQKCGYLMTAIQMADRLGINAPAHGCPVCDAIKFSPTNIRWFHWFLPRVWTFAVARLRGRA